MAVLVYLKFNRKQGAYILVKSDSKYQGLSDMIDLTEVVHLRVLELMMIL